MRDLVSSVRNKFIDRYGRQPIVARAPGRINLIGEHTDYNDGFVLPAAVDKELVFALAKNEGNTVRAYAVDIDECFEFPLDKLVPGEGWINYVIGVVAELIDRGLAVQGFDMAFGGDVPAGSGMSSSAALECGLGTGLNALFQGGLSPETIALAGQSAEHEYVGVKCGIMDQFASTFGKAGQALRLDCRSLEIEYHSLDLEGFKLLLCNTNVKHSLASSEYNTRREQCEQGVELLKKFYPKVQSLRDVTRSMLERHSEEMDPLTLRRCWYVLMENDRVQKACNALDAGDLEKFGELMYASHQGLSQEYEVSCPELDFLVERTHHYEAVLGARMMGGGFGGCTLNLIREGAIEQFVEETSKIYKTEMGLEMEAYTVVTGDGASVKA